MWEEFKRTFRVLRQPTAFELAVRELAEAERLLLEAQTAKSYAAAMVAHHEERINRLRHYIHQRREARREQ